MAQVPVPNNTTLPAANAAAVTLDTDLTAVSRGLTLGTAGALTVVMEGGQTVTIPSGSLSPGLIHPLRIKRVNSAGTTATGITIYW
jgi:hypothetical protein